MNDLSLPDFLCGNLVQPGEIGLPPQRDSAREYGSERGINVQKHKCRHGRPDLRAVDDADGQGYLQALEGFSPAGAGQQRLGGEEVDVEEGRVDDLGEDDFGGYREELGGVVEVVVDEHEPAYPVNDCTLLVV